LTGAVTQLHISEATLALRVLTGFGLAYVLGFERELRGSAAGTRTFALVGATSTCVAAVTSATPQVLAGIITGVGFIGGGVILHQQNGADHSPGTVIGITTAATIFAAAGDGLVIGTGHMALGLLTSALVLLVLELPHIPFLAFLDARRYSGRFNPDRNATNDQIHP
jgi:putative Mg2+ transporter-C (MgtC) family protein